MTCARAIELCHVQVGSRENSNVLISHFVLDRQKYTYQAHAQACVSLGIKL